MKATRRKPDAGDKHIDLPLDWYLAVPIEADENGRQQGFVFRPDGKDSASLNAALGLGHLTGNDETVLPPQVRAALRKLEEQYS